MPSEKFDREHHLGMRHFVGIEETEEKVAACGFVAFSDFDTAIRVTDHRGSRLLEVVEVEGVQGACLGEFFRLPGVVIGSEVLLELACIARGRPDEFLLLFGGTKAWILRLRQMPARLWPHSGPC